MKFSRRLERPTSNPSLNRTPNSRFRRLPAAGWLEYLADGPNAGFFAKAIEATADLIVPAISLYEVFKRVLQQRGDGDALRAVALMHHGRVVELSGELALAAALEAFRRRPALGFSDCLLVELARNAGHRPLGTFDRNLSELDGATRL